MEADTTKRIRPAKPVGMSRRMYKIIVFGEPLAFTGDNVGRRQFRTIICELPLRAARQVQIAARL